jgi:hypothetical protein
MSVTPSALLSLPVIGTGTESGTWGNYVNNGLTSYLDNVIAGTLSFSGDGAITLANTAGDNTSTNIGSTTAQYAMIRVTGTLTTAKVITGPSYSKTYIVANAATGGIVTFKASGQTGVSIAVGETATVYYNGTDYVKSASTTYNTGGTVTSVAQTFTGGIVSVAGSPITSSGTIALTVAGTSGGIPYFSSASTWATSGALTANALVIGGGAGAAPTVTTTASGVLSFLGTPSSANLASMMTDETGSGSLVFATSPTLTTPVLGTPTSGNLGNCTVDGTYSVGFRKLPPVGTKTSSYTIAAADVGKYVEIGSGGALVVPASIFTTGDAVSVYNNTSGNITITCSAVTTYLAGTNTTRTSVTLATRGVANILFNSATDCVITGNVS